MEGPRLRGGGPSGMPMAVALSALARAKPAASAEPAAEAAAAEAAAEGRDLLRRRLGWVAGACSAASRVAQAERCVFFYRFTAYEQRAEKRRCCAG